MKLKKGYILIDLILHKKKAYTHLLYNLILSQAPTFQGLLWKSALGFLLLNAGFHSNPFTVEVVQADERVNPDFLGHLVAVSSQTRKSEMNCFYQVGLQQRLKDHSYLYDKDQFACLRIHVDCQWESEVHLSAPLKPALFSTLEAILQLLLPRSQNGASLS